MTDLEQLSREAAKVLTSRERIEFYVSKEGYQGSQNICRRWLHESTAACAEIMVRVLMPARVDLDWIAAGEIYASRRPDYQGTHPSIIIAKVREADEMQAFRTAVLRALIEVKK